MAKGKSWTIVKAVGYRLADVGVGALSKTITYVEAKRLVDTPSNSINELEVRY